MSAENENPFVMIPLGGGDCMLIREKDAIARGLIRKQRQPVANKMRMPAENKAPAKVDFTVIPGIGPAICKELYNHGIFTFEDLANADISSLSERAKAVIKGWRINPGV